MKSPASNINDESRITNYELPSTNSRASIVSAAGRRSPVIPRPFWIPVIILLLLSSISCGQFRARHRLAQDEIFVEILERENLRRIGEDQFFEECLLKNADSEVRQWAAIALGRIASPRALPLLYKALTTGDAAVRAASAFAVGEIEEPKYSEKRSSGSNPESVAAVVHALSDPSIVVRTRAVEALGKIGSHSEAVEIVRRLEDFHFNGTPAERAYLNASITALGRLGDPTALPLIGELAHTGDPDIKKRASDCLIRIGSGASDPAIKIPSRPERFGGLRKTPATEAFCRVLAANRKNSTIAVLETNRGPIEIELFREDAPVTAANFVLSAEGGDYSGMTFETVLPHRLIEGVSLKARSGLMRAIPGEVNMRQFERGSVGMGLINGDSETGHFFIALTPQPYLDGIRTCFGRVISGMPIADRIVPGDHIRQVTIKETISFLDYQAY